MYKSSNAPYSETGARLEIGDGRAETLSKIVVELLIISHPESDRRKRYKTSPTRMLLKTKISEISMNKYTDILILKNVPDISVWEGGGRSRSPLSTP